MVNLHIEPIYKEKLFEKYGKSKHLALKLEKFMQLEKSCKNARANWKIEKSSPFAGKFLIRLVSGSNSMFQYFSSKGNHSIQ